MVGILYQIHDLFGTDGYSRLFTGDRLFSAQLFEVILYIYICIIDLLHYGDKGNNMTCGPFLSHRDIFCIYRFELLRQNPFQTQFQILENK